MGWRLHGLFIFTRTLSFLATHLAWIFAILSGCAYFRFWKSYDVFWVWLYMIVTCSVPRLRYNNLILQLSFLFRKTCSDGERWRYALKAQDDRIDQEDEYSSKISNAFDLAVTLLRLRVSAAILIGEIHVRWILPHIIDQSQSDQIWSPMLDWGLFQLAVWIDLCLFWFMLSFMWCRQCWLCCQLGCCKYYLWCALVVFIGAILMEIPMYFVFQHLDTTWCNLTVSNEEKHVSASINGPTTPKINFT